MRVLSPQPSQAPRNLRLFYAIRPPRELTQLLGKAQTQLRGNWRPVRPEQLHITLAFLPHAPAAKLGALRDLGRTVARGTPAFTARLGGTGYFPAEGSPRVWFVKVDAPELDTVAAQLRAGLDDLQVPYETTPFKPHVTLARRKGPAPRLGSQSFDLSWDVRGLSLMQSRLFKTGPVYEQLAHHSLWHAAAESPTPEVSAQGGS